VGRNLENNTQETKQTHTTLEQLHSTEIWVETDLPTPSWRSSVSFLIVNRFGRKCDGDQKRGRGAKNSARELADGVNHLGAFSEEM
jgi:hypothetical protein